MDFKYIKEKFPKSYREYLIQMFEGDLKDEEERIILGLDVARNLYDFFDSNDMIVTIDCKIIAKKESRKLQNGWIWMVNDQTRPMKDDTFISKYPFNDTRIDAEKEAFHKAFELLEEKL